VDQRGAVLIGHYTDLQRFSTRRWTDEHRDRILPGLESSPVVSKGVKHVVVGNTVLAGARLDVEPQMVTTSRIVVNIC